VARRRPRIQGRRRTRGQVTPTITIVATQSRQPPLNPAAAAVIYVVTTVALVGCGAGDGQVTVIRNMTFLSPAPADAGPRAVVHEAYLSGSCDSCHDRGGGSDVLASAQDGRVCAGCHTEVATNQPFMHGPVVAGACARCHKAHESDLPHLLASPTPTLCFQCHDVSESRCAPAPGEPPRANCLSCHFGHGGDNQNFLRPGVRS
jgi:predicted CXXCH cytochrome family protein